MTEQDRLDTLEIVGTLPTHVAGDYAPGGLAVRAPNAYVYTDNHGRLCVRLPAGTFLGVDLCHVQGDFAPDAGG